MHDQLVTKQERTTCQQKAHQHDGYMHDCIGMTDLVQGRCHRCSEIGVRLAMPNNKMHKRRHLSYTLVHASVPLGNASKEAPSSCRTLQRVHHTLKAVAAVMLS